MMYFEYLPAYSIISKHDRTMPFNVDKVLSQQNSCAQNVPVACNIQSILFQNILDPREVCPHPHPHPLSASNTLMLLKTVC